MSEPACFLFGLVLGSDHALKFLNDLLLFHFLKRLRRKALINWPVQKSQHTILTAIIAALNILV